MRYFFSKKNEADDYKNVSLSFLKSKGYLEPGYKSGTITWTNEARGTHHSVGINVALFDDESYIRFHYTQTDRDTDEKKDFDYRVPLTTTRCHFGGKRYWYVCPMFANSKYCGRRVGVLYKIGDFFACRHCYNLTYNSRNITRSGKFYPFHKVLTGTYKAEEMEMRLKRRFYAGKPTRKYAKLLKLQHGLLPYAEILKNEELYY